jgi:hypothetical protein
MSKGESIMGKERSDKRKPLDLNDKRKKIGKLRLAIHDLGRGITRADIAMFRV